GLDLPDDQQHIAVGQPREVVMGSLLFVVELEVPDEFAFPRKFLNPPAGGRARDESLLPGELAGAQQVTSLEQVRDLAGVVAALPGLHDPPLEINQVSLR